MSEDINIRWGRLKFMYVYTIVVAGGFGLGMIVIPEVMKSMFGWPVEEPIAFGILSIFGLRSPLKFVPILLLQLFYKSIWFVGVVLPLLVAGRFPDYGVFLAVVFATFIVGDLIAIPFSYIFTRQSGRRTQPLYHGIHAGRL